LANPTMLDTMAEVGGLVPSVSMNTTSLDHPRWDKVRLIAKGR
jgi:hypothetical protein